MRVRQVGTGVGRVRSSLGVLTRGISSSLLVETRDAGCFRCCCACRRPWWRRRRCRSQGRRPRWSVEDDGCRGEVVVVVVAVGGGVDGLETKGDVSQSRSLGRLPSCPNYLEPPALKGRKVNERDVVVIKRLGGRGGNITTKRNREGGPGREGVFFLGERASGSDGDLGRGRSSK